MATPSLVQFWCNNKSAYNALTVKEPSTVYFCKDTGEIYRGTNSYSEGVRIVTALPEVPALGVLYIIQSGENMGGWVDFGTGITKVIEKFALVGGLVNATSTTAGLMTPTQVGNLDLLMQSQGATSESINNLRAVKADKVVGAVSGNFAALDSEGNLTDSGKNVLSFKVTMTTSESADFAKTYTFSQDGAEIGSINIPKDMVISSGHLEDVAEGTVEQGGEFLPAGKYIVLVVANAASDKIYIPASELCDVYKAGDGIEIDSDNKISLKAVSGNGFVLDPTDGLKMNLATQTEAGALSPVDKLKIDRMDSMLRTNRYAVVGLGEGCLCDIMDHEIRVMFPSNFNYKLQNSGEGSDPTRYYYGVKTYVPDNTVYVEQGESSSTMSGELFTDRVARGFAGVENGRKYIINWFVAAKTDDGGTTWTYYGDNSTYRKLGNYSYVCAYSDAEHTKIIAHEVVRIYLENENSWRNPVSQFNPVLDVDTTNGLTLVKGKLGFNSSMVAVAGSNIKVNSYSGEETTLDLALAEIYKSVVWQEW